MKFRFLSYLLVVLSVVSFSSCKTQNIYMTGLPEEQRLDSAFLLSDDYQYRIRKDDKLTISLWGQDELSVGSTYGIYNSNEVYGKWLMVDYNGEVPLPKIGDYEVEGKTLIELKNELTVRYSEWIREPVVDVKVLNREITVLGEVKSPGTISVDKERNEFFEVIAKCNGFDSYANLKYVKVLRQKGQDVAVATLDLTDASRSPLTDTPLLPGDVVIIPSKKYKEFDRRVSVIIPFTSTMTAAAIFIGLF